MPETKLFIINIEFFKYVIANESEHGYLTLSKWLLRIKPTLNIFTNGEYLLWLLCRRNIHLKIVKLLSVIYTKKYCVICGKNKSEFEKFMKKNNKSRNKCEKN